MKTFPTLISKMKIDGKKQMYKLSIKKKSDNNVLIEIETGPEGGEPFIYEIPIVSDEKNTASELAEEKANALFADQIKEGYVLLSGQTPEVIDKSNPIGKKRYLPPAANLLGKKQYREGTSTINKKEIKPNQRQSSRLKEKSKVDYSALNNSSGEEDNDDDADADTTPSMKKKVISSGPHYPMLAYDYKKKKNCIKFPCYVQPKLDGVRAVGVGNRFYSRNWIQFPELNHIKDEMSKIDTELILDGELYTDDINFEAIVGLVRKANKTPEEVENTKKIYYNVFDCIDKKLSFKDRYKKLEKFFAQHNFKYLRLVKTETCNKEKDIETYLDKYIKEGYEGVIMRNIEGKYEENTRSVQLQKLKRFMDAEFKIVGYQTPTSGKEVGCVIWECVTKEGNKFTVRPEGSYDERKKLYKEGKKNIGKLLTVRFQEYTKDKMPRFPVGVSIRDYE